MPIGTLSTWRPARGTPQPWRCPAPPRPPCCGCSTGQARGAAGTMPPTDSGTPDTRGRLGYVSASLADVESEPPAASVPGRPLLAHHRLHTSEVMYREAKYAAGR